MAEEGITEGEGYRAREIGIAMDFRCKIKQAQLPDGYPVHVRYRYMEMCVMS